MLPVRWLIVFGLAFVTEVLALPTPYITRKQNGTTEGSPKDGTLLVPSKESTAEKLARLSQCLLKPVSPTLTSEIQEKLDDGARLIHMYLTIVNHTGQFPGEVHSDVFEPLRWTRSTGTMGRGIMMLKNTYNILSMNTLNYEVEYMYDIALVQDPPNCLSSMDIYDVQEYLGRFLLNDAKGIILNGTEDVVGNSTQEICNFHINVDDDFDMGYFHYECCHLNGKMELVCERLLPNLWITAIIICVFVLNIVVVFFSPFFVPKSFYEAQEEPAVYEFSLKNPETLRVKYTNKNTGDPKEISLKRFSKFSKEFKNQVDSDKIELNSVHSFEISKIKFNVQPANLLSTSSSPIGIWSSFYNRAFLCEVGKDEGIYSCCTSSMAPFRNYKWQDFLRRLMHAILLLLVSVPWIVRVILYYIYEDEELSAMREAASERGVNSYYVQASFAVRYLTPVHAVFLLCYLVIVVDSFFLGLVFNAYIAKFKRILVRCLSDMDAYARFATFDWLLEILVYPLEKLGLYALPFIVFYWALMTIVLAPALLYYLVPTINIFIRLVLHWWAYLCPSCNYLTKFFERNLGLDHLPIGLPWKKRLFEFFIVNMCLLTMSSYLFLAVESLTFFVEILVYTLVGIILNADVTLKYVSLTLMLLLYTRDSFGSVTRVYTTYTESIINVLRKIEKEQVDELGICDENKALTPHALGIEPDKMADINVERNELTCTLHNVIMFIDKEMNAFRISKSFYYQTIDMNVDGCPGRLFPNVMKALRQLLMIMVFLMFVFLVVSAFGDRYEVSGVSQMLATLVGGFLPWIFSNILFRSPVHSTSIDTDSATFSTFKRFLHKKANSFTQDWQVVEFLKDLVPERCSEELQDDIDLIVVQSTDEKTSTGKSVLSSVTEPFLRLSKNF